MPELRPQTVTRGRASGALALFALPPSWAERASCSPETAALFFRPDGERGPAREVRERAAISICAACPVRAECLTYAVDTRQTAGVWGGQPEHRLVALRNRARAADQES